MVHRSSQNKINLELSTVSERERPIKRLEIDFADLLIGPTSGEHARKLASLAAKDPYSLALAMRDASERFLKSVLNGKIK